MKHRSDVRKPLYCIIQQKLLQGGSLLPMFLLLLVIVLSVDTNYRIHAFQTTSYQSVITTTSTINQVRRHQAGIERRCLTFITRNIGGRVSSPSHNLRKMMLVDDLTGMFDTIICLSSSASPSSMLMSPVPVESFPIDSFMMLSSTETISKISPEPIHTAFSIATFLPQPFWLLIILLPSNSFTKKIMGGLEIPLLCCLIHFFIVSSSIMMDGTDVTAPLSEFNDVFNPAGDPQKAFMGMTTNYPNFVAEEWSHVLTWDLFVGRYIWLDGLRRGIFTSHSVLLSNLIGPPGLLLHWLTCTLFYKKPILEPSERDEIMNL